MVMIILIMGFRILLAGADRALAPDAIESVRTARTSTAALNRLFLVGMLMSDREFHASRGSQVKAAIRPIAFSGAHADMLLGAMPPVARLREDRDKADLRWALERMRRELVEARPGGVLVAQHLAHLMLVEALRLYLSGLSGKHVGWLFALADPRLAAAIGAMHARPGARWTLPELAREAGMSRSSFARAFKATVGTPPLDYLTRWRMLLAGARLTAGPEPVGPLALTLGYESESAFSTAFKRVMGCSPGRYARVELSSGSRHPWAKTAVARGQSDEGAVRS